MTEVEVRELANQLGMGEPWRSPILDEDDKEIGYQLEWRTGSECEKLYLEVEFDCKNNAVVALTSKEMVVSHNIERLMEKFALWHRRAK